MMIISDKITKKKVQNFTTFEIKLLIKSRFKVIYKKICSWDNIYKLCISSLSLFFIIKKSSRDL